MTAEELHDDWPDERPAPRSGEPMGGPCGRKNGPRTRFEAEDDPEAVRGEKRRSGGDSGRPSVFGLEGMARYAAQARRMAPDAPEADRAAKRPQNPRHGPANTHPDLDAETLHALADLAAAIVRARELHPEGVSLAAVVSEVGEVATAMLRETPKRVREESLDAAVTLMRAYMGEWESGR